VIDPSAASVVTRAGGVRRLVEQRRVANDDLGVEQLHVRDLTHQVVNAIGHRAAQVLQNRLQRNKDPRLTRTGPAHVPHLVASETRHRRFAATAPLHAIKAPFPQATNQ
jgi:hypothetical protein